MAQKRTILFLSLILCLGSLLRLYKLGVASLWFDEAFVFIHSKNLNKLLTLSYPIPPLYVVFMRIWGSLYNSEFFLRLPSVFFALVTVLSLYLIGKQLFGKREGLLSALLLSTAPFHIYYSQEANKYVLLGLFGVLSVYFLYRALETSKFSFWSGYTIFTILSIYTQYVFLLILFGQFLFVISRLKKKHSKTVFKWLIAQILLLIGILPWFSILFFQIKATFDKGITFWSGTVNLKTPLTVFGHLYLGYNTNFVIFVSGVMLFSYLFFRGVFIYRHFRSMLYLTFLTIFPILIAWITSQYRTMFVYRYFMISALLSYIIIACGILSFKRSLTKFLLVFSIMLITTHSLNNYYASAFPLGAIPRFGVSARQDFRSLAKFLINNFRPGDIICHTSIYTIPSLQYYLIDRLPPSNKFEIKESLTTEIGQGRYLVFAKKKEVVLYLTNVEYLMDSLVENLSFHKGLSLKEINFNRMWVVIHCGDEEERNIDWANNNFEKDKEIELHGIKLLLYLNPEVT